VCLPPIFAELFLSLLFHPDDEGGRFIRNVGLSPNYSRYNPKDRTLKFSILIQLGFSACTISERKIGHGRLYYVTTATFDWVNERMVN
jgi:hypothetical protein